MKHKTKLRIWSIFSEPDRAMLKTPSAPVDLPNLGTPAMQKLIDEMLLTMRQAEGIGLAAPQIGQPLRIAVVAGTVDGQAEPYILVNPVTSVIGSEQIDDEEGCLSIPGVFGIVPRAARISLKAFDRHGQPFSLTAEQLLARVIQHEVDHLNGVLFLDRLTSYTKGQEKMT